MKSRIVWFAVGFVAMGGCQKPVVFPVTFDSGIVKSIELPEGFKIKSLSLKPWVVLADGNTNQSFSLQVVTPADDTWIKVGNLTEASKMMGEDAEHLVLNGRHWVILPLNGVLAYSLENDVRIYFLGQGNWNTRSTVNLIKGIALR